MSDHTYSSECAASGCTICATRAVSRAKIRYRVRKPKKLQTKSVKQVFAGWPITVPIESLSADSSQVGEWKRYALVCSLCKTLVTNSDLPDITALTLHRKIAHPDHVDNLKYYHPSTKPSTKET